MGKVTSGTIPGDLAPGTHVLVRGSLSDARAARSAGLHSVDTIAAITSNGILPTFLFRRPLQTTVLENVLTYNEGALNLAACRVGGPDGRHPPNLTLMHAENCTRDSCDPACPTQHLDEQSGDLKPSGAAVNGTPSTAVSTHFRGVRKIGNGRLHADSGAASKFYPTHKDSTALYVWLRLLVGDQEPL